MEATATLPQPRAVDTSDLRLAKRAILSYRESHAVALTPDGNCHARDLVELWVELTGEPMPIPVLRQELCIYMCGDPSDYESQRAADEALAEALVWGDVRLVRRRKQDRRR